MQRKQQAQSSLAGHGGDSVKVKTADQETPEEPCGTPREATLANEDVWMLIRRFNKEIYHVKSVRPALPHELDLIRTSEDYLSPEKLRVTIEWFYMSVVLGMANFGYQIARIRSWNDRQRTGLLCAGYFLAWAMDLIIISATVTVVLIILSPEFQSMVFPPDPEGYDSSYAGHLHKAGHDSLTRAPEYYKGEAAEHEATNLIRDLAEVALEAAHSEYDSEAEHVEDGPDPAASKELPITEDDGTKKEMMQKVSGAMVQMIRIMTDIAEGYERLCNLISPTAPFQVVGPRLRLVAVFVVMGLSISLLSSYWLIKITTFLTGFIFFGGPVLQRSVRLLNQRCPGWQDYLDPNKTILEGVPTNAQLALTLLRMGEMSSTPLNPPSDPVKPDPWKVAARGERQGSILPADALAFDASSLPFPGLLKLVRFSIGIGIGIRQIFGRARAITGISHHTHLISLLRRRGWVSAPVGPLKFKARIDHRQGTVVIDSSREPPILYFTTHHFSHVQDLRLEKQHKGSILFQIPVPDIVELKKTEELGWKQKLVLELTGGIKYSVDGLIIQGRHPTQSFHLTSMRGRDQLFNRLVAMGAQFWESW